MMAKIPTHDKATLETVTDIYRWTDRLFSFKTTRPPGYHFIPGQFARLGLTTMEGNILWRAYSITSIPAENHLEYYGVIVPGGAFTTILQEVTPGSSIWVEKENYGFMTADRLQGGDDLWLFATGTGLGPYISILRDSYVWGMYRHLVLVHCVRYANEFSYEDQLYTLQQHPPLSAPSCATLQIIQTITSKPASFPPSARLQGRITTLLNNGALEKKAGLRITPVASRIMMCGNPEMIEETRRILHQRGLRPCRRTLLGQFLTENYW